MDCRLALPASFKDHNIKSGIFMKMTCQCVRSYLLLNARVLHLSEYYEKN